MLSSSFKHTEAKTGKEKKKEKKRDNQVLREPARSVSEKCRKRTTTNSSRDPTPPRTKAKENINDDNDKQGEEDHKLAGLVAQA
jgi:hypothetical protein